MKKSKFWIALLGVAILALGLVGFASAQTVTPEPPPYPGYGPGMMGGRGGPGGIMGGYRAQDGTGILHDYMIAAFADALGLTPEELESRLAAGETLWQIALSEGYSAEEFSQLWIDARTSALEEAVADGVITQEQADWMIAHMQARQAAGYGPGLGPCGGGRFGGFRGGMRWGWDQ